MNNYFDLDLLQVTKIVAAHQHDKRRNFKVLLRKIALDLLLCTIAFLISIGMCQKFFHAVGDFKIWFGILYTSLFIRMIFDEYSDYQKIKKPH